jgi:hypothetical protein
MDDNSNDGSLLQEPEMKTAIKSETEALEILASYLKPEHKKVIAPYHESWIKYKYKVWTRHDQSITPPIMASFQHMQDAIYRTYALLVYDNPDIRLLTNEEKESLRLSVKVKKGSSDYDVQNAIDIANVLQQAVNKMSPDQVFNLGIYAIVAIFSATVGKAILQHFLEKRRSELRSKERLAEIEQYKFASENELEKMKVVQEIANNNDIANQILSYSKDVQRETLKAISQTQKAEYYGQSLTPQAAQELSVIGRREQQEDRLDGVFKVLSIDSSKPEVYRPRLESEDGVKKFTAELKNDMLATDVDKIFNALRERKMLFFKLNIEKLDDDINKAHVINVDEIEEDDNP